ncbi:hypothetical protein [Lactobacillus amylolyticus]|uniref:hypothetical protein n=1 Tax=Lactobacillus amylolyticus TaxID=83683 RepID=UPI0038733C32
MTTNYWSLFCSRILTACTAGAIITLVLVLANYIAPMDKRAGLLSWVFAGFQHRISCWPAYWYYAGSDL